MNKEPKTEADHQRYNSKNYFTVPEGYFEKLPEEITAKIGAQSAIHTNKHSLIRNMVTITSLAAAVILVLLVFSFLMKKQIPQNNDISFFSDADQAITEYLEENLDENALVEASNDNISFFDAGKLKEIIASDDTILPNKENTFEIDTTLKKDEILEYLLNENIDPETL
jgi:hypothetical protein